MTSLVLSTSEVHAARIRRECARDFIQVYQRTYDRDANDADIKAHMECKGQPNMVSWLITIENFKVDKLSPEKG